MNAPSVREERECHDAIIELADPWTTPRITNSTPGNGGPIPKATSTCVIASLVGAFTLVAVAMFLIGQDFVGARRVGIALHAAHATLERRVEERTTALAEANAALQRSEASLMETY